MRKTITGTAVALSAAALTLGLAGTAHAGTYGIKDPNDTHHGSDIRVVEVRNGPNNLHVVSTHQNLRRDPATGSGGVVYIDTDDGDKGPEYVFVGGYFVGTDYALMETEGFGRKQFGDHVEQGDYMMEVNYNKERVHLTMSRHSLGDPTDVRLAIRASGTRSDGTSDGLVDWVGKRREMTPWLAQG